MKSMWNVIKMCLVYMVVSDFETTYPEAAAKKCILQSTTKTYNDDPTKINLSLLIPKEKIKK